MNGYPNPGEANPIASSPNAARTWALSVTIAGAAMATALSYVFITQFFVDVAGMPLWQAYSFGGFLEVCLVGAGLQARARILDAAEAGVLITLTWVFSGISAALSASHEIVHRGADGTLVLDPTSGSPLTMIVRAVAPLVAAIMWHLLLIGEKHLVSGLPRGYRRHARLMHTYLFAREELRDLVDAGAEPELIAAARDALRSARKRVFRIVPVDRYQALLGKHLAALHADFEGSARVERMSETRKPVQTRKPAPRIAGAASSRQRVLDSGIPNPEAAPDQVPDVEAEADGSNLDAEARNLMIVELWKQRPRYTQKDIARRAGVSDRTVRTVIKASGLEV
jgi:hypothetical protein